jgi:ACS family hexuronate transporter-like MFS transporter
MQDSKGSSNSAPVADPPVSSPANAGVASVAAKIGRYRWKICALLFFATTLNYMDRQVLALLKPTLECPADHAVAATLKACINPSTGTIMTGIGLTEVEYGFIVSVFSMAYALGLLLAGGFMDRVGTKIGYAICLTMWSFAAMAHALVYYPQVVAPLGAVGKGLAAALSHIPGIGSMPWVGTLAGLSGAVAGFCIARFFLGLAEAGNFPAAVKTTAEWFPKKERAFATGIFNSGSNVGATLAPILVPWIAVTWGWHWSFVMIGLVGLPWVAFWVAFYRTPQKHPRVSPAELAYINSDPPEQETKVAWRRLIPHRQTWAFIFGKSFTDPIWWFYLYWLPGFLHSQYGLSIVGAGLPLLVIYNMSAVGSIYGGWLPGKFISWGWNVNRARKTAMFIYACCVVPIVIVCKVSNLWVAVALISLAAAAHQAWSANMFTLASDMFPRRTVGSVVGIGAFGGAAAMMAFGPLIGWILEKSGNYFIVFLISGSAYLLALLTIHVLAPRLKPADVN